jgi:glycosyltransferase involved in cell wall biosynthesis
MKVSTRIVQGVNAMSIESQPLVSVVTPVYNMGNFLAECIESVLRQTYKNFEYIIVNNCSTDRTLEIALSYAKKDSRVRVHNNNKFVEVIENHNIAFSLISPAAKYCKVVSADDFIFGDCIMRMVEVAESNPSVGIVGSYQLSGSYVRWQGFKYPRAVIPGREMCRQIFLGGDKDFGCGNPTSLLYRADLVRNSEGFYPNSSPHSDTSACFKSLQYSDFGFVYQVLSYGRIHKETQSFKSKEINRYLSAGLNDVIQYGPFYLSKEELELQLKKQLNDYHRVLAVNVIGFRGKEFWDYHKSRLEELGYPIRPSMLLKAGVIKVLREILNPEQAIRKFWRSFFPPNLRILLFRPHSQAWIAIRPLEELKGHSNNFLHWLKSFQTFWGRKRR